MSETATEGLVSVVLAAGAANRFGTPKQLAMLDGETLIARAAHLAAHVTGGRRLAVTGAHHAAMQPALDALGLAFVHHPGWARGPGSSIAAAVAALPGDCSGVLIWAVDQAGLTADALQAMCAAWARSPQRLVCAGYAGSVGAPAIFPRRLFMDLRALPPARGAKALILADDERVVVPMPEAALDIDTPADLAALQRQLALSRARGSRNARS